ncbi:Hypothetical predicted protein, partial [Paramuricea clavata]
FYLFQLGLPEEDSEEFKKMSQVLQKEVQKFYLTGEVSIESWLNQFKTDGDEAVLSSWVQENKAIGSIPWLAKNESITKTFTFVYYSLNLVLDAMSNVSLKILLEKMGNKLQ